MITANKVLPIVASLGLFLIPTTAEANVYLDGDDKWLSDFGPMQFVAIEELSEFDRTQVLNNGRITHVAVYPDYRGSMMSGIMDDNVLNGYWYQTQPLAVKCKKSFYGTHYWGKYRFKFTSNSKFTGLWNYCDKPVSSRWNGRKSSQKW